MVVVWLTIITYIKGDDPVEYLCTHQTQLTK